MWGIFVGIAIGFLELFLLKKAINILLDVNNEKNSALPIIICKFAIILVVLFVLAKFFSVQTMLFCAGGMLGVIIIIPMLKGIKTVLKYKKKVNNEVD